MHLILTHDQADFDAMASLLAARLLEPSSRAVIPHRINRNVRDYLTLYGEELPLDALEDLPRDRVDRVTLVDTQTMPTVHGAGEATRIHVVDHHPLHKPLAPGWTSAIDMVGAATTLLVESLQTLSNPLTVEAATLMLLGIYEDTGSLSYAGTSPRDVRAAAWLLEQNASLALTTEFLNRPLSTGQRELYNRLLESVESLVIQGQRIVLAQAVADAGVEEISTIAHKLRDLFEPDGLFVVVDLGTHLQLVARSATDNLDVSEIAARFGGGGHNRAAAALIRGRTLDDVRRELLDALPASITPPMQVAQIYSPRPKVVEADLIIADAAERMARYGYEGFPVVRDGKVVGLLTRRAVDRALAHGMQHAQVESVMEGGSVTVQLGDSVSHLQRLMVDRGWGQIPVVSPEGDRVVGIVTRTDLLKALAPGPSAGRLNLKDRLEHGFPASRLALLHAVAAVADRQHIPLYLVGGVVRDLLLKIPSFDLDLVVEGDAIALARAVADEYGGRVRSHERFGTAKWLLREVDPAALGLPSAGDASMPESLDLVSARAEFYAHPSALPEVERGNLKLDLHRRDFTINTLALSINTAHFGEVYDYWGGLRDLEEKQIRVMHSISFIDDPTRILRAVRLEQRLGFRIEPRTRDLIALALPLLHRVSGDRIRHELEAIFDEPTPGDALGRLRELNVLGGIYPGLEWSSLHAEHVGAARAFIPDPFWSLASDGRSLPSPMNAWLLDHPKSVLEGVLARLNFPRRDAELLLVARQALDALDRLAGDAPPSRIADALEDIPEPALVGAYVNSTGVSRERLNHYLARWRTIQPETDGETLRRRGLPPGPRYGEILRALRAARLDGRIGSAQEETRMLDDLLSEMPIRGPETGSGT
jgi:tRNA nucleotidyltransferase (CCA-adding enzyme)